MLEDLAEIGRQRDGPKVGDGVRSLAGFWDRDDGRLLPFGRDLPFDPNLVESG